MPNDDNCIFCKIVRKEVQAPILYEDEYTLAFLDIRPASPLGGHTLVIPKNHYVTIVDIPNEELYSVIETVRKLSSALMKFALGVNILQNNGKSAGQFIMHAHFHIIPRFEDDGITIEKWKTKQYKEGEVEEVLKKIKSLL
jgi:histidine triad (HIT) family protein